MSTEEIVAFRPFAAIARRALKIKAEKSGTLLAALVAVLLVLHLELISAQHETTERLVGAVECGTVIAVLVVETRRGIAVVHPYAKAPI